MTAAYRVCIATPVYGGNAVGTMHAKHVESLMAVLEMGPRVVPTRILSNCDLVRARSRAVAFALDYAMTHVLFWDSDVAGETRADAPACLSQMLKEDKDVIAAAYPRKSLPPRGSHQPPYVAMGFTLIKATCLEKMWDAYYDELHYDDILDGKPKRLVALFHLLFDTRPAPEPHRMMLGEDYSFCERWLRLGGQVHLYDGPGAPLMHIGGFAFQGTREEMLPKETP